MASAMQAGSFGLSILCHILILLVPLSLAPKIVPTYPPVEMVMTLAPPPAISPAPRPAVSEPPKPKVKRVKSLPPPRPRPTLTEPEPARAFIPQPPVLPAPAAPVAHSRPGSVPAPAGPPGPILTTFGSATGPAFLRRVLPVYPEPAKRLGKEGRVVLRLHLDARGNLQRVEVVEGAGFGFEEAAIAAVKQSSFRPAMVQGEPRACIALLPVRFVLKQ